MGSRAGLDGCGKSRIRRDSIPGPSTQQRVAIPTELWWAMMVSISHQKYGYQCKFLASVGCYRSRQNISLKPASAELVHIQNQR